MESGVKQLTSQFAKNETIKFEYKKLLKKLQSEEKHSRDRLQAQLRKLRMELIQMRAYGEVYHQMSFVKFDKSGDCERFAEEEKLMREKIRQKKLLENAPLKETMHLVTKSERKSLTVRFVDLENDIEGKECAKNSDIILLNENNSSKSASDNEKIDTNLSDEKIDTNLIDETSSIMDLKLSSENDRKISNCACDDENIDINITGETAPKDLQLSVENDRKKLTESQIFDESTHVDNSLEENQQPQAAKLFFLTEESDESGEKSESEIFSLESKSPSQAFEKYSWSPPHSIFQFEDAFLMDKRNKCAKANSEKMQFYRSLKGKPKGKKRRNDFNRITTNAYSYFPPFVNTTSSRIDCRAKLREMDQLRLQRASTVFPEQCRNTYTLKKIINKKAEQLIYEWTPENVRKVQARKYLDSMDLPVIVSREKTTSAIYRDYNKYKDLYHKYDHPRPKTFTQRKKSFENL